MNHMILRKIRRCEALSKSSNANEASVALKQMNALINQHNVPYKANQVNFNAGDKVVFIDLGRVNEIFTIQYVMHGDHLRHPVVFMGGANACGVTLIRHASSEEILADRRSGGAA